MTLRRDGPPPLGARTDSLTGEADRYGQALTDSAGSILTQLRAQGTASGTLDQLGSAFADGPRIAMAGSAGFLLPDLVSALAVTRAARRG